MGADGTCEQMENNIIIPKKKIYLSQRQKIERQIAAINSRLRAIQANPALRKDYRQAIQELIKLRRQQIRLGKNKGEEQHEPL